MDCLSELQQLVSLQHVRDCELAGQLLCKVQASQDRYAHAAIMARRLNESDPLVAMWALAEMYAHACIKKAVADNAVDMLEDILNDVLAQQARTGGH